jgi:hypothetical protein
MLCAVLILAACGGSAATSPTSTASPVAPGPTEAAAGTSTATSALAATASAPASPSAWRADVASQACSLITTTELVALTGAVLALPDVGSPGQCSWSLQTKSGQFSSLSLMTYGPGAVATLRALIVSKTGTPIDQVVDGGTYPAAGQSYTLINGGGFSLILSGAIDKPADQALKDISVSIAKLL